MPRSAICQSSPPPRPAKRQTESPTGHNFRHIFSSLKYHSTWPSSRQSIIPSKPEKKNVADHQMKSILTKTRPSERSPFTPLTLTSHTCSRRSSRSSDRRITRLTWFSRSSTQIPSPSLPKNPLKNVFPRKTILSLSPPNFRARSRAGKRDRDRPRFPSLVPTPAS